jgi:hypothetical protein
MPGQLSGPNESVHFFLFFNILKENIFFIVWDIITPLIFPEETGAYQEFASVVPKR